jgi:hypothetical protein
MLKPATGAPSTSMASVNVLLQPFCAKTVSVAVYWPGVANDVLVCGPMPVAPLLKLQFHPMIAAPVVVLVLENCVCDPAHALLSVKLACSGFTKERLMVSTAAGQVPLPVVVRMIRTVPSCSSCSAWLVARVRWYAVRDEGARTVGGPQHTCGPRWHSCRLVATMAEASQVHSGRCRHSRWVVLAAFTSMVSVAAGQPHVAGGAQARSAAR